MTNAETVVAFGRRVWGKHWQDGMGTFAQVSARNLERIQAAAREGQEYPAARGVLAALHEHLAAALDDLEPWARHEEW